MDDDVKDFLIDQDTPDMIDIYDESWELLKSLGHEGFEHPFVELMMISNTGAVDSFLKHFKELLHDNLDMVISEHGIETKDNPRLSFKNNLLRFFMMIERTEYIEQCLTLLESDETNNTELFCEVVSIVIGGVTVDDLMIHLEPISNSVINCLREYMRQRCELETAIENMDTPELKVHYRALEAYGRIMSAQTTIGYVLAFQPDGSIGGDFKEMLNIHLKSMNRINVNAFAKELVALAIHCDCWKSPQVEIEKVLPNITENLRELAVIQHSVGTELQLWNIENTKEHNAKR